MSAGSPERRLSSALSAHLCGTRFPVAPRRRGSWPERLASEHGGVGPGAGDPVVLGGRAWEPAADARVLADRLRRRLEGAGVVDLVVFGSHARGSTTASSDFDAVLVIEDATADDLDALQALRRRVVGAQRDVLRHQPMQHHGFEVVTPRLLEHAGAALAMPPEALAETVSLFGRAVPARFRPVDPAEASARARALAGQLVRTTAWPRHPWSLHRLVSMFALLPALWLQARGQRVAKAESFAIARRDLEADWWAYDVLADVRGSWPRVRAPGLHALVAAVRNPWTAVALWRRAPVRAPAAVASRLGPAELAALVRIADRVGRAP